MTKRLPTFEELDALGDACDNNHAWLGGVRQDSYFQGRMEIPSLSQLVSLAQIALRMAEAGVFQDPRYMDRIEYDEPAPH